MKSIEELKSIFLQERINYWKCANPQLRITVHRLITELETIQVIIGKPSPVTAGLVNHGEKK